MMIMHPIAGKVGGNCLLALTQRIVFHASKMQASSTQKTKDSAGRRLGLALSHLDSKSSEEKR